MAEYKNIIGTAFPNYVTKQIEDRKNLVRKDSRDRKDLLWLTNRTGWYRITSGAKVNNSDTLAQNNILQGGTVKRATGGEVALNEGFSASYPRSGELGFRPMPNVESLSVTTGGRWQTLLQGELEITAYDLNQLDIISKLYMSLGVHLFIEWGHTPYIDKAGAIQTKTMRPIDMFDFAGSSGLNNVDGSGLVQKINRKKESTAGNYEALIGRVYNFDYNANPDGTYSCKVKVMGAGAMVDSLKASNFTVKDADATPDNDKAKYGSDIENALKSISNVLNNRALPKSHTEEVDGKDVKLGEIIKVGRDVLNQPYTSYWGKIGNALGGNDHYTKPSYGKVLREIYDKANYKGFTFTGVDGPGDVFYYNDFSAYGNATPVIHQMDGNKKYGLSPIPTDFYAGYVSSLTYQEGSFLGGEDKIKATYITLGHLFALVQHLGVFVVKSGEPQPAIYLDYHPDNTIIKTAPIQASIDPSVCLVPFKGSKIQENAFMSLGLFLNPLDLNQKGYEGEYSYLKSRRIKNAAKNFTSPTKLGLNKVNGFIPKFDGKLFNILINVDFARKTLEGIKVNNEDRVANIREYLDAILAGVNRALGGINNFKLNFVDCAQTLRVVDEHFVPKKIEYIELPTFGKKSIVYDYNYSSKISKELAAQIVISSQASTRINEFPDDILSFKKLNQGVTDRFSEEILPPCKDDFLGKEEVTQNLLPPQSVYDQLYKIYALSTEEPIEKGVGDQLLNYYGNLQTKWQNYWDANTGKGGILIPMELSITMDGISGILPYNAFLLPSDRLPKRYKIGNQSRIAFIVFSINHTFDNNQWKTTLRGQTIMRPKESF